MMTLTEALKRIEALTEENKRLKEDIEVTESLAAQANLLNFFDYDYLQLREMV